MITLFSGIPGSGKSYKMVAELSRLKNKYYVVHNIDSLKEGYLGEFGMNFLEYCKRENMEVVDFFNREYQIKYCAAVHEKYNRPILVIIDEAHEWFHAHSKALRIWLSYHRHLDQDIWLVAHRSQNLPSVYRSFIEVEYRAKSGSILGFPGYFVYNRILGGQKAGYKIEKKKQEIFDLYKSQLIDNKKKRKIPLMLPILGVIACIGVVLFFWIPSKVMGKNVKNKIPAITQKTQTSEVENKLLIELQKMKNINNIEEKYAYVGNMDGRIILEDRISGEQLPLEKISLKMRLVEVQRLDSCIVFTSTGQLVSLFNSKRFVPAVSRATHEPGLLPEIKPFGMPSNSSIE